MLTRSDPVPSPGLGSNYDLDAGSPPVLRHAGVICSRRQICQRSFPAKIGIEARATRPPAQVTGEEPGRSLSKNLELKFIDHADRKHIDVTLTCRGLNAHIREHLIFHSADQLPRERVLSPEAEA